VIHEYAVYGITWMIDHKSASRELVLMCRGMLSGNGSGNGKYSGNILATEHKIKKPARY
jgi:hypothetical protein